MNEYLPPCYDSAPFLLERRTPGFFLAGTEVTIFVVGGEPVEDREAPRKAGHWGVWHSQEISAWLSLELAPLQPGLSAEEWCPGARGQVRLLALSRSVTLMCAVIPLWWASGRGAPVEGSLWDTANVLAT